MSSYAATPIPPALAERLQEAQGLTRPPATLGDYVSAIRSSEREVSLDASTLCCGESRHEIVIDGETTYTHCVLDSLLLPLVEGRTGIVRSTSPSDGQVVTLRVTPDRLEAEPASSVISFGMLREGTGNFYELGCPYINAFASVEEYKRWADATPEAVMMPLSVDEGVYEFARDLVGAWE